MSDLHVEFDVPDDRDDRASFADGRFFGEQERNRQEWIRSRAVKQAGEAVGSRDTRWP
jgi:hypothetical protein